MQEQVTKPRKTLSTIDGVALVIGVVIGTGIFKTPSLVAASTENEILFFAAWLLGGMISLIGALCYAELASAYPHAGGDYHYLNRAFGLKTAFLFGWARMTVIQPGSIAMLAFVFGDYLSPFLPAYCKPSLCAAFAVITMTILNMLGTQQGKWIQNFLTAAKVLGIIAVLIAGIFFTSNFQPARVVLPDLHASFGLAMVFVLLTFGGWNEAVYISAELREEKRDMIRILLWGIGTITLIYLLAGFAYLKGLGLNSLSHSEVAAADLMRKVLGEKGAVLVSLLISFSALGAINATVLTGARTNYALGRDFYLFKFLGCWQEKRNTPANALLTQGIISLALVLLGSLTRQGFVAMVEFTTPVFWFFFLLTGISLFVLRAKEPGILRPFTVPLYPAIPLLFCITCVYMLRASIVYTGIGALAGLVVFFTGGIFVLLPRLQEKIR